MINAIFWPQGYVPGFADHFVSNEVIMAGLTSEAVWPFLAVPAEWPGYYANAAHPRFHEGLDGVLAGPSLALGARFSFETFGFLVEAQVTEYEPPLASSGGASGVVGSARPGRLAWHGWCGAEGTADRLDVHHAWLIEDLSGGRVRILTQETQNGEPAKRLATTRPSPMINGHQAWLDGLVAAAREAVTAIKT